jgi:hypothetical protein
LREPFVGSSMGSEDCRSRLRDIGVAVAPHDCVVVVCNVVLKDNSDDEVTRVRWGDGCACCGVVSAK